MSSEPDFKIHNTDCYLFLKNIPDQSVNFILTDPPYNISSTSTGNIKFNNRKDMVTDLAEWDHKPLEIEPLCHHFKRILKPRGNILIFTSQVLLGDFHRFLNPDFDTTGLFAWHKTNPAPRVRKTTFLPSLEIAIYAWNKGHQFNFISQNAMHNHFESPACGGKERLDHPTQKPIKLLKHLIKIFTNKEDLVFDPFMGTGSTGHAALELERNFLGIELEKKYFQMAEKRLEKEKDNLKYVRQHPLF